MGEGSLDDFESELVACRHIRAVRLFTDSIVEDAACSFTGHECADYEKFQKGECGDCGASDEHCASMGYHAKYAFKNRTLVPFYMTTTARSPYCLRHYRVSVTLADPEGDERQISGHFTVSLYGPKGKLEKYRLPDKESTQVRHGESTSFLVTIPSGLGPLHRSSSPGPRSGPACSGCRACSGVPTGGSRWRTSLCWTWTNPGATQPPSRSSASLIKNLSYESSLAARRPLSTRETSVPLESRRPRRTQSYPDYLR